MEATAPEVTATVTDPIDAQIAALSADQPHTPPEAQGKESAPEPSLTAKQMAAAEELNAAREAALTAQRQQEPAPEPPPLIEVAAQGMDALHEALRQHGNRPVPEYVPPARTERQMKALEEELEAGRRAGERAAAQDRAAKEARAAQAAADARQKEGFTTPVYRPNDVVPHPLGGMGQFGAGAVEEG